MKQSVNPAVMAVIIVVVVAVVAFIGFKVFAPSQGGFSDEMRKKYNPSGGGAGPAAHPPPGTGPGGGYRPTMGGGYSRPPGR